MLLVLARKEAAVQLRAAFVIVLILSGMVVPSSFSAGTKSLYSKNEVAEIRRDLNKTNDSQTALNRLQDLLVREPDNAEAHMLCGTVLQYLGYEKLADEQYAIVDKLDPSRPNSALAQFKTKLALQGPTAAYEYLRYVEARFPRDPSVLLMQGMLERANGNQMEAEYFYKTALDLNPSTPGIATALAALRIFQKRYKEAVELADRDLKLKKDHPAATLAKGQALLSMGQAAQSIPYLQKVFKSGSLDRKEPSDLIARAYVQNGQYAEAMYPTLIAMAWSSMKDTELSDKYKMRLLYLLKAASCSDLYNSLQIALEDTRDLDRKAWLCYAVGDVLDRGGCLQEAESVFTQALRLRPVGRGFMRLAKVKEKRGDAKGSFLFYEQAAMVDKQDLEISASNARNKKADHRGDLAWQLKNWLRSVFRNSVSK
ncbi:MAG: hypothetical protein K2X77_13530 [Candidatus Obscuribacterales bacterium]|jgi:tetratricopeptide (TPR) repeat protein|nr:hypothetical protein [Candidatus Obscuribacterales bacterium]